MLRVVLAVLGLLSMSWPVMSWAAPTDSTPRLDAGRVSALPSYLRAVEPAAVGIHVEVPRDRPSTATLGSERWGSGIIFDELDEAVSYIIINYAPFIDRPTPLWRKRTDDATVWAEYDKAAGVGTK